MPGPSISASEVAAACVDTAVSVLADMNKDYPLWFEGVFDVGPIGAVSHPEYGDKSTTIVYGTGMDEYEPGADVKFTTARSGYTPQGKIRRHKKAIAIPRSDWQANNGLDKAVSLVSEFVKAEQRWWTNRKNRFGADLLNKGSLTAGSVDAFAASFLGNVATYDGFIYDGQPLFSDAHPLRAPNGSTTTFDNYMASQALSSTTFGAAFVRMSYDNAIDETGERIQITPRKLIVPTALRQAAFGILNTQNVPGTANYEGNVNAPGGRGIVDHIVCPFLTDAAGWFLVGDPEAVRIRDSGPLRLRQWEDAKSDSLVFEVQGEFLAYVRDARHLLAANTAQS